MATVGLSPTMTHDIAMLMGDAKRGPVLKRFISKLKKDKAKEDKEAKLKFEAKLKADLTEALQELKDEKEGKTTLMTMDELYAELEKND